MDLIDTVQQVGNILQDVFFRVVTWQKSLELVEGVCDVVIAANITFKLIGCNVENGLGFSGEADCSDSFGLGADPAVLLDS